MAPQPSAPFKRLVRIALQSALARAALVLPLLQALPAYAEPPATAGAKPGAQARTGAKKGAKTGKPTSADRICRTLTSAAADNGLPVELFMRLIWQESRFNPNAVSPAGAQGIAQFMPGTAAGRGLTDPFEPLTALRESAAYLAELRTTFGGNLGLAAAAYNAGPGRVEGWLDGRRSLPGETRAYVRVVTGHGVEAWTSRDPPRWQVSAGSGPVDCSEAAKLMTASLRARPALRKSPAWGPWGVQLAAKWSQGRALATYERLRRTYAEVLGDRLPLVLRRRGAGLGRALRYIVRVAAKSRVNANALCAKLRAAGGACIVLRNPG